MRIAAYIETIAAQSLTFCARHLLTKAHARFGLVNTALNVADTLSRRFRALAQKRRLILHGAAASATPTNLQRICVTARFSLINKSLHQAAIQ